MQDVPVQSSPGARGPKRDTVNPPPHAAGLLFLREEEIRAAQDMMFFAMRDLTASADVMLAELGYGRAHHRALHWIGRRPNLTVGELLAILGVTKQSLTRVLGPLVTAGYVAQAPGPMDRRQRLLSLTESGLKLERQLFDTQRERMLAAYREAGGPAVDGFRRVLRGLTSPQGRAYLDAVEPQKAKAKA
jgi:DNA-binding MarR family transcriptional regulator